MARELAAQPAAREDRELQLLAGVGLPEVRGRDPLDALPEPADLRVVGHRVEVRVEMVLELLAHAIADPRRDVDAVGDAQDGAFQDGVPGRVGGLRVEL